MAVIQILRQDCEEGSDFQVLVVHKAATGPCMNFKKGGVLYVNKAEGQPCLATLTFSQLLEGTLNLAIIECKLFVCLRYASLA
jgi:hypothetical protein